MTIEEYNNKFGDVPLKRPNNVSVEQWEKAVNLYNVAKNKGDKYPELTVAQAALETGWFKSPSGKYNYFGQKASKDQAGTVRNTKEVENNKSYNTQAKFRDYDSLSSAVDDRINKWANKYTDAANIDEAIGRIWQYDPKTGKGKGYATDDKYDVKLKSILGMMGVKTDKPIVEEKIPPMEKQIATTTVTDLLNTPEITNFEPQTENEIQFLNEIKSVGIIPQQISVPQLNINTQQPTQQTVQPTPRTSISDIYDRISQFVETPVAQQGGNITQSELDFLSEIAVKDNLGFWNPNNQGKVVEINSPRISMKNLNYDVLGISKETGEKRIMKPDQEYYFKDTQKVIELPLQKY